VVVAERVSEGMLYTDAQATGLISRVVDRNRVVHHEPAPRGAGAMAVTLVGSPR